MLRTNNDNSAIGDRGAAHPIGTSTQTHQPLFRRVGAFAATLACCALVAATWERSEHRPRQIGHPEGAKAIAERIASAHQEIEHFQQFAINALVLPLIDDTEPPRWTRAGIHWICDGRGKVAIDGAALIEGAPVPAGPFSVRWDLQRCAPFAGGELLAEGEVELHVTAIGADLRAQIAFSSLSLETPVGSFSLPVIPPDRFAAGNSSTATR